MRYIHDLLGTVGLKDDRSTTGCFSCN